MDISASNWNEDDASNIAAAPDGAPEGMAPSGVNNVMRAMMGGVKRWFNWSAPRTTGGTLSLGVCTTYTLAYSVAPGGLVDGVTHLVQFHAANGVAATLNVNGLGAIPLHYYAAGAWRAAPPGLIDADLILRVAYNASAGAYRILNLRNGTGEIAPFAGTAAAAGALLCYGQAISRTSYAGLFAAIGTNFGLGDGSTTFNVPDLRGRVAAGKDDMGGGNVNRLSSFVPSTTMGGAGGQQSESAGVTVSGTVTVGVSVSGNLFGSTTGVVAGGLFDADGMRNGGNILIPETVLGASVGGTLTGAGAGSNSLSGSTLPVSNVQPTLVLNYVIRI